VEVVLRRQAHAAELVALLAGLDDPADVSAVVAAGRLVLASHSARPQLTGREREVLVLVAQGWTNVAIARALAVSPRTVAKHLEHAYRKLGVCNRAAAVGCLGAPPPAGA
jgi:DNA-binding NarL/FixJ family response regulator